MAVSTYRPSSAMLQCCVLRFTFLGFSHTSGHVMVSLQKYPFLSRRKNPAGGTFGIGKWDDFMEYGVQRTICYGMNRLNQVTQKSS